MGSLAERRKAMASGEEYKPQIINSENPRPRRLTNRQFTVIGYERNFIHNRWYTKKKVTIKNVSLAARKRTIEKVRKMGCYRVDSIETNTIANEEVGKAIKSRRMAFAKQIFAAANSKFVPQEIQAETKAATQATAAWEILNNLPNAWLDTRPIVKVSDRQAKLKAERKRNQLLTRDNGKEVETIKIFDRKTQGFMFSADEEWQIVAFIEDNKLALEDIILYVNNETYWQLVELEK